jgi:hypothetical protein
LAAVFFIISHILATTAGSEATKMNLSAWGGGDLHDDYFSGCDGGPDIRNKKAPDHHREPFY